MCKEARSHTDYVQQLARKLSRSDLRDGFPPESQALEWDDFDPPNIMRGEE